MCGRFSLAVPVADLCSLFGIDLQALLPPLTPRYNIAPTQTVPVVRASPETGQRELAFMRWGLIPSWSKDPKIGAKLTNARAETITEKPSFRSAYKKRRCLVPTTGFYEWRREGKTKQPFYIRMRDTKPYALGGIWEKWTSPEGEAVHTFSIITTGPNEVMLPIHDRMPVIVPPEHFDAWLDPKGQDAAALAERLDPITAQGMEAVPVSNYVNKASNEGLQCVAPPEKPDASLLF